MSAKPDRETSRPREQEENLILTHSLLLQIQSPDLSPPLWLTACCFLSSIIAPILGRQRRSLSNTEFPSLCGPSIAPRPRISHPNLKCQPPVSRNIFYMKLQVDEHISQDLRRISTQASHNYHTLLRPEMARETKEQSNHSTKTD